MVLTLWSWRQRPVWVQLERRSFPLCERCGSGGLHACTSACTPCGTSRPSWRSPSSSPCGPVIECINYVLLNVMTRKLMRKVFNLNYLFLGQHLLNSCGLHGGEGLSPFQEALRDRRNLFSVSETPRFRVRIHPHVAWRLHGFLLDRQLKASRS